MCWACGSVGRVPATQSESPGSQGVGWGRVTKRRYQKVQPLSIRLLSSWPADLTREFQFCPRAVPRWACLSVPSTSSPGQVGKGLSTYLAPRRQRVRLSGKDVCILCSYVWRLRRPVGAHGWPGQSFPILQRGLRIGGCRG